MGVSRKPPIEPIIAANEIISFIRNLPDDDRVTRTAGRPALSVSGICGALGKSAR